MGICYDAAKLPQHTPGRAQGDLYNKKIWQKKSFVNAVSHRTRFHPPVAHERAEHHQTVLHQCDDLAHVVTLQQELAARLERTKRQLLRAPVKHDLLELGFNVLLLHCCNADVLIGGKKERWVRECEMETKSQIQSPRVPLYAYSKEYHMKEFGRELYQWWTRKLKGCGLTFSNAKIFEILIFQKTSSSIFFFYVLVKTLAEWGKQRTQVTVKHPWEETIDSPKRRLAKSKILECSTNSLRYLPCTGEAGLPWCCATESSRHRRQTDALWRRWCDPSGVSSWPCWPSFPEEDRSRWNRQSSAWDRGKPATHEAPWAAYDIWNLGRRSSNQTVTELAFCAIMPVGMGETIIAILPVEKPGRNALHVWAHSSRDHRVKDRVKWLCAYVETSFIPHASRLYKSIWPTVLKLTIGMPRSAIMPIRYVSSPLRREHKKKLACFGSRWDRC